MCVRMCVCLSVCGTAGARGGRQGCKGGEVAREQKWWGGRERASSGYEEEKWDEETRGTFYMNVFFLLAAFVVEALYMLYRSTNLLVVKKKGGMSIGWCNGSLFLWSQQKKKKKTRTCTSAYIQAAKTSWPIQTISWRRKKLLMCIGSMFINFKPADGKFFSSHIYCDVSKGHFSFVCRLKQKQTEGWARGTCAVKKDFSCFSMMLQHVVSGLWFCAETPKTHYNNKTYGTYKECEHVLRSPTVLCCVVWGVRSHPGPGWLSAATEQHSHKASGPAQTGTVAPPDTRPRISHVRM